MESTTRDSRTARRRSTEKMDEEDETATREDPALSMAWYGNYSPSGLPGAQNRVRPTTSNQNSLPRRLSISLYQPGRFVKSEELATLAPLSWAHETSRLRFLRL